MDRLPKATRAMLKAAHRSAEDEWAAQKIYDIEVDAKKPGHTLLSFGTSSRGVEAALERIKAAKNQSAAEQRALIKELHSAECNSETVARFKRGDEDHRKTVCWGCDELFGQLHKCSKCRIARYCGPECQTKHWRAGHKAECARLASL